MSDYLCMNRKTYLKVNFKLAHLSLLLAVITSCGYKMISLMTILIKKTHLLLKQLINVHNISRNSMLDRMYKHAPKYSV